MAAPLGAREQLTFYREPVTVARAPQSAVAPGFVFLRDQGGNENAQVYYYDSQHARGAHAHRRPGRERRPGVEPRRPARGLPQHGARRRELRPVHRRARQHLSPRRAWCSTASRRTGRCEDWSPDDTKLLISNFVSANESHLYVLDIASAALTPVSEGAEPASVSGARFTADGRGVYLITNRDSEFEQLRRVDLVTGAVEMLTGHIPWDIDSFARSDDGHYLAWVANVDGISRLTVVDVAKRSEILPPLPDGRIGRIGFDPAGKRLAFSLESPQSPRDVFVFELERNAVVRYTRSEAGPVDPLQFVRRRADPLPDFRSRQRQVPAGPRVRLSAAPGTRAASRCSSTSTAGRNRRRCRQWNPFTQFLVREMGFVVITPNVRGSTGYGKTYLDLDNGEDREDAVKDIGALLVWIGLQRDLDAKRVFVAGGSYGGYMSLASMVNFSDRLRGGIDVVGISNFVTFLESTSAYRRNLRRPEYGDERLPKTRAYLQRISPLTNAARISKPLLVVQGLNDPRVPASESQQMVAKIRGRGGEVWYLAATDEGSRIPEEGEPRLLPEDDRDLPRETAGREVAAGGVSSTRGRRSSSAATSSDGVCDE